MDDQKRIPYCRAAGIFILILLWLSTNARVIKGTVTEETSLYPVKDWGLPKATTWLDP